MPCALHIPTFWIVAYGVAVTFESFNHGRTATILVHLCTPLPTSDSSRATLVADGLTGGATIQPPAAVAIELIWVPLALSTCSLFLEPDLAN